MGEVYRADDLELGQSVALKFLPQRVAADESWLRRFRNEVRTARQVAHANVCRIYDIGEEDGHVFLSMEYIDGEDLASVLRRLGRPSEEKALEIARQICLGLAAAHDSKVLHRDLKPANIMIDGRGHVRITDFGLAGFLDDLERVEARAGTPAYMAPEQLVDGRVSVRSDIYTLGLILHELFTGKCVFETDDVEELKRRHTSGSVTPPSSIAEEIDPAVERVIARCLQEDPEQRPQSVYQVLAALPGGDPLAAALAAGELPSPELVANARDAGGLRPLIAVGLVIAILASLTIAYLSSSNMVRPERSPARLSVVAEQIMEEFGYGDLPRYSVAGYDVNTTLASSLWSAPQTFEQLQASDWPPRYRYWRRWSDEGFVPSNIHFPETFAIDGPSESPDTTATVALDSTGRLLALRVPPRFAGTTPTTGGEVDWSILFDRAQLDQTQATTIEPDGAPPIFCDTIVAWRIGGSTEDEDSIDVLMGAVDGRPSYLEYPGLHDDMSGDHVSSRPLFDARMTTWAVMILLVIILACRNMRAGQADHVNALRWALLTGGLYAVMEVLSITLGAADVGVRVLGLTNGRAVGHILLHSIEVWVLYLAIEPNVRRVWPRMLIGIVRLLSGRSGDPAVGREVLIGLAAACMLLALLAVVAAADRRMTAVDMGYLAPSSSLQTIMSPAHFLSERAHVVAWAVLDGVWFAGVVVIIRLLVRHPTASAVLAMAAIGALE
ncbi:MAG: serine/threonine-protein kinase, partial [Planctomycetota bacterium]